MRKVHGLLPGQVLKYLGNIYGTLIGDPDGNVPFLATQRERGGSSAINTIRTRACTLRTWRKYLRGGCWVGGGFLRVGSLITIKARRKRE